MEKKLYDAAIAGDVTTLSQLLQDDPLVLDKASLNCEDKNPLHLAAMLGQVEFVKSVLQVHHSANYMCFSRDRDGRNPVHLAAMYGKLEVLEVLIQASHRAAMEKTDGGGTILHLCVKHNQLEALKMLLQTLKDPEFMNAKNEDGMTILHLAIYYDQNQVEFVKSIFQVHHSANYMCFSRDRDGRNPVHLAAMYGKLEVLEVLIQASHRAAMEKTDGGGTILHLCVKHNQLEVLKMLLQTLKDPEFINAKNEDGMTILHLAIYYDQNQDQYQTIIYLLDGPRIKASIKNANDKTALDLLRAKGPINSRIRSSLLEMQKNWLWVDVEEKSRAAMMVVASLIATMAFQAGISPPGGVWQDDLKEGPNPHRAGEAVMAQTHPKYYRHMVLANTVAFVASLGTIILLIMGASRFSVKVFLVLKIYAILIAITTTAMTYGISLATVVPKGIRGQLSETFVIVLTVLMVWYSWMYAVLYDIIVRCTKGLRKWFRHRM